MFYLIRQEDKLNLGFNIILDDVNAILNIKLLFKIRYKIGYLRLRVRKVSFFLKCKERSFSKLVLFDYSIQRVSQTWFNYLMRTTI